MGRVYYHYTLYVRQFQGFIFIEENNKMGVDLLVYRVRVGLFCLCCSTRIKSQSSERFPGKTRKIPRCMQVCMKQFISDLRLILFSVRLQVNYTSRSPFNNLHLIYICYSLACNCIILLICLVLAGDIHPNPGPNSGREKYALP